MPLIGAVANLCVLVGRWIHGQVRLPIPCYDLTELRTATLALPPPSFLGGGGSTRLACVDTCDGQCERAPGTHSARYDEARLRNVPRSRPPSQRPVPTTRRLLPRISPGGSLCAAHCNTRVTQDIECIRTYPRPACLALSRTVGPLPLIGVGPRGSRRFPDRTRRSLHGPPVAMHNPGRYRPRLPCPPSSGLVGGGPPARPGPGKFPA